MEFSDKSVVITGSSRGIGAACARRFAAYGADIMINHNSDDSRKKAVALADEINDMNSDSNAVVKQADVSESDEAHDLIDSALHEFGSVDILVNNAGINRDNLIVRMKDEQWQRVIEVNLTGAYNCTRSVTGSMMKSRWGRIINMTSVVGMIGNPGQANYAASKAGIIGMTKSLARELASRNITVNAVAPGFVATKMTEEMPEKAKEALLSRIPLERKGKPEEVASAVAFLASDQAEYITGEVIKVSGGLGI